MLFGRVAFRILTDLPDGVPVIRPVTGPVGDFDGKPDSVWQQGDTVLTGLGADPEAAGAWGVQALLRRPHVAVDARGLPAATAARVAAGAILRAWRFDRLRTRPDETSPRLTAIDLVSDDAGTQAEWTRLSPGIEGALFVRDLVTEPSNVLTPATYPSLLARLAEAGVSIEVLDAAALARQGFGGILAVGGGSAHPPCLIVLRWAGTLAAPPVAFVGKGITFDTGGICIKPADKMWEMRADMAGSAACAGAMLALALRRSPAPAMAVLAVAENAIGAASYRPGDVLRMHAGSTVAVVDTDAEGRLVLADALSYAVAQKPAAIIDLATLTGSIVVALGHEMAGAFTNNEVLREAARAAGAAIGERIWPMPIEEAHLCALDSDIADIRHCVAERGQPDASQAAAFLRSFVGEVPWLHLDIAGVEERFETSERHPKGATGFGARLLDRLVAERFEGAAPGP